MGEWKAPLSLRVKPETRVEMEQFAEGEKRSLGNLGALVVVWAFEQLKAVGSTERLLKSEISPGQEMPSQETDNG